MIEKEEEEEEEQGNKKNQDEETVEQERRQQRGRSGRVFGMTLVAFIFFLSADGDRALCSISMCSHCSGRTVF